MCCQICISSQIRKLCNSSPLSISRISTSYSDSFSKKCTNHIPARYNNISDISTSRNFHEICSNIISTNIFNISASSSEKCSIYFFSSSLSKHSINLTATKPSGGIICCTKIFNCSIAATKS